MAQSRSRGKTPARNDSKVDDQVARVTITGHPVLSFRHLQSGFGVEELNDRQCRDFLLKWSKRSQLTWAQLATHDRHGLGSEKIPSHKIKPSIPEPLKQDDYKVMRHHGNLPFVGIQAGDLFYVLWIEAKYDDVYKH